MSPTQTAAFAAFLSTLNAAERAAFMDMTSTHVGNIEESCEINEEEPCDHEGYDLLAAINDAVVASVAL